MADPPQRPGDYRHRFLDIGTWNVRTAADKGKIEQIVREADRLNLDVLALAEVRWPGTGKRTIDGWTFYYIGNNQHEIGVGFLVSPATVKAITTVNQ